MFYSVVSFDTSVSGFVSSGFCVGTLSSLGFSVSILSVSGTVSGFVSGVDTDVLGVDTFAPVPLLTIFCIALYVSVESNFVETIFPFNIFVIYVLQTNPFAPFCVTTS